MDYNSLTVRFASVDNKWPCGLSQAPGDPWYGTTMCVHICSLCKHSWDPGYGWMSSKCDCYVSAGWALKQGLVTQACPEFTLGIWQRWQRYSCCSTVPNSSILVTWHLCSLVGFSYFSVVLAQIPRQSGRNSPMSMNSSFFHSPGVSKHVWKLNLYLWGNAVHERQLV